MSNIMGIVANQYSKKLDEPFKIKSEVHKVARLVRFTRDGMEYYDEKCQKWYQTEAFLREILTGKAVVMR